VNVLVRERDYESLRVVGQGQLIAAKPATPQKVTSLTKSALSNFRDQLHNLGRDAAGNYTAALSVVSSQLDPVRTQADKLASQASLANAKSASALFDEYSGIIDKFLDADQAVALQIDDAKLRNGAELLMRHVLEWTRHESCT
jgi:hypothetical protein